MAPRIRSDQLETRTARRKLTPRRKPYTLRIAPGIRIAYRRNVGGCGSWSVICADGLGGRWLKSVARADDQEDANGKAIMDFWQAVEACKKLARSTDDTTNSERPLTVKEAITDLYKADLEERNANPDNATRLLKLVPPALLARPVSVLTPREIRAFRKSLRERMVNGRKVTDATVNRYMKQFKACLSTAARIDDRITNGRAWKLSALPDATTANNIILEEIQTRAVIAESHKISRPFGLYIEVLGTFGCRPIQARRLRCSDIYGELLVIPTSKKGSGKKKVERKPLPVPQELAGKLRTAAEGRADDAPLLLNGRGTAWGKSEHAKPFAKAAKAAKLPAGATVYCLRHTSIVRCLLRGMPARLVASMHDTSIVMLERHYSKYITDPGTAMMRAAMLDFAEAPAGDNVVAIR